MGDRSGMSISADSPSDETLNQGPLALLLQRQYEFAFGINIVQFSICFSRSYLKLMLYNQIYSVYFTFFFFTLLEEMIIDCVYCILVTLSCVGGSESEVCVLRQ